MPPDDPAESFKNGLDAQWAVEYGEDAFSHGIAETSNAFAPARLSWADEHDRWGWINPSKELKHLFTSRTLVAVGLHRELKIDQGDVDLLLLDQPRRLAATTSFQAPDAEGIQQARQFRRRAAFTPGGGKQQIQATRGR
ncbi:MAG: hypothetical protein O3A19_02835 [Planctomycetota bacterium]|jgi:hypothetical protein|nr:hypothetical protein [Planctomycetota bacterium]MDA1025343.1 hypothetical protein [Planctomycetota bacterium]